MPVNKLNSARDFCEKAAELCKTQKIAEVFAAYLYAINQFQSAINQAKADAYFKGSTIFDKSQLLRHRINLANYLNNYADNLRDENKLFEAIEYYRAAAHQLAVFSGKDKSLNEAGFKMLNNSIGKKLNEVLEKQVQELEDTQNFYKAISNSLTAIINFKMRAYPDEESSLDKEKNNLASLISRFKKHFVETSVKKSSNMFDLMEVIKKEEPILWKNENLEKIKIELQNKGKSFKTFRDERISKEISSVQNVSTLRKRR